MRFFKLIIATVLICSLLLLSSCTKEQGVTLSTDNIEEYVGINFSFGEISVTEMSSEDSSRISCICYVEVFPIGECAFDAAKITLSLKHDYGLTALGSSKDKWVIYPQSSAFNFGKEKDGEISVSLNKEGNGSASFYLCREGDVKHPLQSGGDWSVEVTEASGTATAEK